MGKLRNFAIKRMCGNVLIVWQRDVAKGDATGEGDDYVPAGAGLIPQTEGAFILNPVDVEICDNVVYGVSLVPFREDYLVSTASVAAATGLNSHGDLFISAEDFDAENEGELTKYLLNFTKLENGQDNPVVRNWLCQKTTVRALKNLFASGKHLDKCSTVFQRVFAK